MSVHLHLLSFYDHVHEYLMTCNMTLLCQDYVMVRRLSLKNLCRNLVKTLYIMAMRRNKYSLHNCAYRYFVLIRISHVGLSIVLSNDYFIALNFLSSASTFGRKRSAYLICLRWFIHTNCISVDKPLPSFA